MILCPLNGESSRNVFRGIICLFAVNNDQIYDDTETRCLHYFQLPYLCSSAAQIWRPHSEPYKFLSHILKNNSAAENCTDVRLGQVVNLSIFFNIWNSWPQTFHGFDLSFWWRNSENQQYDSGGLQNILWWFLSSLLSSVNNIASHYSLSRYWLVFDEVL